MAALKLHTRLSGAEVSGRRKDPFTHGKQNLGERRSSGSRQEMADIGFYRTDDAGPAAVCYIFPELLEACDFGRIADRRPGGMTFDQIEVLRLPTGLMIGGMHSPELSFRHRGKQASPHIVGKTGPANDAVNPVSMRNGIFRALQEEYACAFSDYKSVTGSIER